MFCSFFAQIKFDVSDRELVIPLCDGQHDHEDEGYSHEVVQRILAAKDEGLVSDKAYYELRMALPKVSEVTSRHCQQYCRKGGHKIRKSK